MPAAAIGNSSTVPLGSGFPAQHPLGRVLIVMGGSWSKSPARGAAIHT